MFQKLRSRSLRRGGTAARGRRERLGPRALLRADRGARRARQPDRKLRRARPRVRPRLRAAGRPPDSPLGGSAQIVRERIANSSATTYAFGARRRVGAAALVRTAPRRERPQPRPRGHYTHRRGRRRAGAAADRGPGRALLRCRRGFDPGRARGARDACHARPERRSAWWGRAGEPVGRRAPGRACA